MKLRAEFLSHNSAGESYLVPTADAALSGMVKGNKTLGAIIEYLKEDTTEEQIVEAMRSRFDAPEGAIERDVKRVIEELQKIDALE